MSSINRELPGIIDLHIRGLKLGVTIMKLIQKTINILAILFMILGPTISAANAASGSFIGVQGEQVSGDATVLQNTIKLSSNFKTTSGPDLYVYLGNDKPTKIIAKLKRNSGRQTYTLPDDVDLSRFSSIFIHCKKYNHTFGKANFQ